MKNRRITGKIKFADLNGLICLFVFFFMITSVVSAQQTDANQAIQKRMDNQYQGFITKGDFDYSNERYNEAKGNYQKALEMDPGKGYPLRQIQKIDSIQLVSKAYSSAVERADYYFKTKKFEEAKNYYLNAIKIKGRSKYAENKVDYIDSLTNSKKQLEYLDNLENIHFKQKEISDEEKYNSYVVQADEAFNAGEYNKAGRFYEWALLVLPKKKYALVQLNKVFDILDRESIARSDLDAQKRKEQDSLRVIQTQKFYESIENANRAIRQGQFELAVTYYNEAGRARPNKISDVDQLIAFVREKQATLSQSEKHYEKVVGEADREYMGQEYRKAHELYVEAGKLLPLHPYPKQQIARADSLITFVEIPYDTLMQSAKVLEDQNRYEEAIQKYKDALKLKPLSKVATSKVDDLQHQLENIRATSAKVEEKQAAYLDVVRKADMAFREKDYATAVLNYELALNLKPLEKYPADKLAELKEIQEQQRSDYQQNLDSRAAKEYDDAITLADEHFKAERYEDARIHYKRAFLYNPAASYPQSQLDAIEKLLSKNHRNDLAGKMGTGNGQMTADGMQSGLSKSEMDKLIQFQELQKQADEAFNNEDYAVARVYYQRSLALRANDEYAKKQLSKITEYLKARKNDASNQQYKENIQKADQAFQVGDLSVARFFYQYAKKVNPGEEYPDKQLEAIAKMEEALQQQAKEKEYLSIVAFADSAYYKEDFSIAKHQYSRALALRPGDDYVTGRLGNIRKVLELQQNDKVSKAYLDELRLADNAFFQGEYAQAGFHYKKASALKPDEEYPKKQIEKVEKLTK